MGRGSGCGVVGMCARRTVGGSKKNTASNGGVLDCADSSQGSMDGGHR